MMMRILQINSTANWGSTGKIAEQIGMLAMQQGWESYIAYGRNVNTSRSKLIKIGSKLSVYWHLVESRLFDNHGLASRCATRKLIKQIKEIQPDIIHLHNIHGYYLNYKILFNYLNETDIPIVWTLHDCWTFTGHCAHYISKDCKKWTTCCDKCDYKKTYPSSLLFNSAKINFTRKRELFCGLGDRLTLVPVSKWLAEQTQQSFFGQTRINYIYNGINTEIFTPKETSEIRDKYSLNGKFVIVGVATKLNSGKGYDDYIKLREELSDDYIIFLVGLSDKQISSLPDGIIGIQRTKNQQELADIYSMAEIVLSLSRAETFGLTIAEGMACGTPAIVYNVTAVPELITPETGLIVDKVGDINGLVKAIEQIRSNGKQYYSAACRKHAEENFDKDKCFAKYIELYNEILTNKNR